MAGQLEIKPGQVMVLDFEAAGVSVEVTWPNGLHGTMATWFVDFAQKGVDNWAELVDLVESAGVISGQTPHVHVTVRRCGQVAA